MPDLFAERIKAFSQLRSSLERLGEPTGLDAYRERLKIQADVNKESMLDAESMLAKLNMQSMISDMKYKKELEYNELALDLSDERQQQLEAEELGSPEMESMAALGIAETAGFKDTGGLFGRSLKPGQEMGGLIRRKLFKPELLLKDAGPQIQKIIASRKEVETMRERNVQGTGQRQQALLELVTEFRADMNDPYVVEMMQKKGDEREINLYNQYLDIANKAEAFINQ